MDGNGVNYSKQPDKVLIEAFKAGDINSYVELYNRYFKKIRAFLFQFLGYSGEYAVTPEDVTQDTFIKLYKRAHQYNPEDAEFITWLYTIAKNDSFVELRRRKRKNKREISLDIVTSGDYDYDNRHEAIGDGDLTNNAEKDKRSETINNTVTDAIQTLSKKNLEFSTAVILRDIQELPYEIISQIQDVPLGTVKSRIHRAREFIKKELGPYLF